MQRVNLISLIGTIFAIKVYNNNGQTPAYDCMNSSELMKWDLYDKWMTCNNSIILLYAKLLVTFYLKDSTITYLMVCK